MRPWRTSWSGSLGRQDLRNITFEANVWVNDCEFGTTAVILYSLDFCLTFVLAIMVSISKYMAMSSEPLQLSRS